MTTSRKTHAATKGGERIPTFRDGICYFLLGYHDEDFKFPSIETYVYLGKNLLGEDASDDRWYFLEAESFVHGGKPASLRNRNNDDILCVPSDLLKDFLDARQLAKVLETL
jgi:hypothetical protein